jgi:feruloyl-CoA synthase
VWHQVTFAVVAERSRRIGAALRALGASESRPVMILGRNGIEHALVTFGALRAGIPVAPVPPSAISAARGRFARLRSLAEVVRPGVVFAHDGAAHAAAAHAVAPDVPFVCVSEPPPGVRALDYASLLHHAPLPDDAVTANAETVAKILFASDPAGEPKGVVTTHAMLCALLQGVAQAWPFLDARPPVIVDALPWSGALGGNLVLGIALRGAGTLYVDDGDGEAAPERFERRASLRAELQPTLAFDVPRGWSEWALRLRADDELRRRWLARLDLACWSGATLAPAARDALRAIGVPLAAAWGATETSGAVTLTTGADPKYDALGVPLPGVELKLVPHGDAYEARARGPQVMQAYYWRPELTAAAFDDEGFLRTGDLVRPIHKRAPERGIELVSRVDERFKLSSGVWVQGAELRAAFLAECSDAADVLVSGEGRDEIGLLVWPAENGLRLDRDVLRAQIASAMRRLAGDRTALRPRRALIETDPLLPNERGERGTLARRAILVRRAAAVARLHASEPDAEVILA